MKRRRRPTKRLRPFFSYYGAKWRMAPLYPVPRYGELVETHAGSACYALLYPHLKVTLCDSDPVIAGIWQYLIRVKEAEILALPDVVQHIDELGSSAPQEARWLVGFWISRSRQHPSRRVSGWMHQRGRRGRFWTETTRQRIAAQLRHIRHWRVIHGDHHVLANRPACWFVDAPYKGRPGKKYRHGSGRIDYQDLGLWCRERLGQLIVCEAQGADWLPFEPLAVVQSNTRKWSPEAVYMQAGPSLPAHGGQCFFPWSAAR